MAQQGTQGELTRHLSVAFVLTLLTFCYKNNLFILHRSCATTQLTCPPGPELLENVNSTRFLSTFTSDTENFATQSEASRCSLSVVSWARGGGFGKADGRGAVWTNFFRWIVVVLVNSLDEGFTLKRHRWRLDVILEGTTTATNNLHSKYWITDTL